LLRLINDKRRMGDFVNGRIINLLVQITVAILILLTVVLVVTSAFPNLLA
jgi:Mn2+/Fe2+ NRAMP family transporter